MGDDAGYYFDEDAANRVCRFFSTCLQHFEGKFAGQPFALLPWQTTILREVFGWKRPDGTRRYRTVYIEVPRKNGKSAWCAGLALYLLGYDHEPGAQVFSVACNVQQANITFGAAKKMVEASSKLQKRIGVKQYHLEHPKSLSTYKALSGESVGSHGKNIHALIVDEFHEQVSQSSRELYEALVTSMGMRSQPLVLHITTAGHGGGEPTMCKEMHDKATKYINGDIKPGDDNYDDTFYSAIYGASASDDWQSPDVWAKANPSLGHTVTVDYLQRECIKAKDSPAYENTFRRLYLDQWTEQSTRWLSLDAYNACVAPVDEAELDGARCVVGLDLSQSYDLTAAVAVYMLEDDHWVVVPRLYCPNATAEKRWREDGINYVEWIKDGHVIGTDGLTVDYDRVEADIIELAGRCDVVEVAFDPYNATQLTTRLEKSGIVTVPVNQSYLGMSAACKEFERRLVNQTITIADNACMRWMAANVEVEQDRHGNIRPVKPRASGNYAGTGKYKIDGIVATIVAISRAMLLTDQTGENEPTDIIFI